MLCVPCCLYGGTVVVPQYRTAQTFNPKEPVDPSTLPIKYHRNSQTYTCKTRSSQCVRECGTQVLG